MDRIGVLLPTWIGDTCMATPMIRALRKTFPDSHLTIIGRPILIELLAGATGPNGGNLFDAAISYNKRASFSKFSLALQMRKRRFDCLLLAPNAFWAAAAAKISLARRTVGYGRDGRSWLLTDPVPVGQSKSQPQIQAYLGLSHWLGCDQHDKEMLLGITPDEFDLAARLWEKLAWRDDCPTLVINNNTALDRRRVWPADRVEALARHAEEKGWQVLLHCGPGERNAADAIAGRIGNERVASMGAAGELPIGLTKAVLDRANLVLTSDSGPRHIAAALGRPVVSLFGPTEPVATQTFNAPETLLRPEDGSDSMQDISLERVLETFDQIAPGISTDPTVKPDGHPQPDGPELRAS